MRWVKLIGEHLTPSFGGFPSFCDDPDGFLEEPEVREELLERGIKLEAWDGDPEVLAQWSQIPDNDRPIVRVTRDVPRHLVDEHLPDAIWISISVLDLFPKIDPDIARSVPREHWDGMLGLLDRERPMRTRREAATMVSRAIYGVDPAFVAVNNWTRAVMQIAASGEAIPEIIAAELVQAAGNVEPEIISALCDVSVARSFASSISRDQKDAVSMNLAASLSQKLKDGCQPSANPKLVADWTRAGLSASDVLNLGLAFGKAAAEGLQESDRAACNEAFAKWVDEKYNLALTSMNPDVLCLHRLLQHLDEEYAGDRLFLLVIDALSVEAWQAISAVWENEGLCQCTRERAAFAVVPTLTSWSRRALFEGQLPPRFSKDDHGPALERKLWTQMFLDGKYFSVGEDQAFRDAIYQGVRRIAAVDVSWDKRGHSLNPKLESIEQAARSWATSSAARVLVEEALNGGYKVVITSDHGQIQGQGIKQISFGVVPEERSKRVILFDNQATRDSYSQYGITDLKLSTMPSNRFALYAPYGSSFDFAGALSISHGGFSIEEVIVPVIEVSK